MNRQHLLIGGAAAIAALALVLVACARHSSSEPAPLARPVRVASVATVPLDETVRAVGVLGPKDEARLAFKVGGVIEAIRVDEGAAVHAGQVLAFVRQAEVGASVEQARQAAEKAERDLNRAKALFADGVATEEQVQDATTAFRVAGAARRAAEFNADYARIVAPADGVVLRKLAQANELVQAGQPVLVVGAATRGWVVRIGLADRDVVRFRLGDPARVEFDAFPGRVFDGRISNLASSADSATGTFTVEVQVEPGGARFVQGLVARVSLASRETGVARVLPVSALLEANGSEASVFVLDPERGVVHRVAVRIGRLHGGSVEVLGGVASGARVVVEGAAFLVNGEAVRIAADAPTATHAG